MAQIEAKSQVMYETARGSLILYNINARVTTAVVSAHK